MAEEGSRARLGDASARRGEGDARRADRPRGDADEYRRGRILEIDGLPDGRSDRLWSGYRLASVDDDPVGSERFLSELLPAFGAADPRAAAFRILGLQLPEELRHLERDLFGLRLDPWNAVTSRMKSTCRSISDPFGTRSSPWVSRRMWNRLPLYSARNGTTPKGSRFTR